MLKFIESVYVHYAEVVNPGQVIHHSVEFSLVCWLCSQPQWSYFDEFGLALVVLDSSRPQSSYVRLALGVLF